MTAPYLDPDAFDEARLNGLPVCGAPASAPLGHAASTL